MAVKSLNRNLHKASRAKKDEFYTQLVDIEKELKHYKEQFHGKVIYCNCDDPFESNFFKYFAANFNALKLKKLIAASYSGSPIIGGQLPLLEIKGSKGKHLPAPRPGQFCIYVLKCADDSFYIGQTDNFERRIKEHHNGKGAQWTKNHLPFEPIHWEIFNSGKEAVKREKDLKTGFGRKWLKKEYAKDKLAARQAGPIKIEISKVPDANKDGAIDLTDVTSLLKHNANIATPLKGTGDFRSSECIELLKKADIVVTNPPFSLFREYVAQLVEHNKKFLIIGDQNAVTYKETFGYIKNNKLWLGYDNGGTKWFQVPNDYDIETESRKKVEQGVKYFSMGRILWFTNLDTAKRHETMTLYKKYSAEEHPKYDNYNIIEVSKVSDIPMDYNGVMGVPITFLDKYNPQQFEILGIANSARWIGHECFTIINDRKIYNRILIKKKK